MLHTHQRMKILKTKTHTDTNILEAAREKQLNTYKEAPNRLAADISPEKNRGQKAV